MVLFFKVFMKIFSILLIIFCCFSQPIFTSGTSDFDERVFFPQPFVDYLLDKIEKRREWLLDPNLSHDEVIYYLAQIEFAEAMLDAYWEA